jgi:hypothetical protein
LEGQGVKSNPFLIKSSPNSSPLKKGKKWASILFPINTHISLPKGIMELKMMKVDN